MTEILTTFILAMTPLVGIRGAIPLAILGYEMSLPLAYIVSVIGEFIPVFFILAFLGVVSDWLSRHSKIMKRFFDYLFEKTRREHNGKVGKYGLLALLLYTGIPLPFSGAWTASLIVFLFGLPYLKSVIVIFFGVMLSGVNVIILLETGVAIEKYQGPMALMGVIFLAGVAYFIYHRKKVNSIKECQN